MGHPKDPADWLLKRNRDGDKHIVACLAAAKGYVCPDATGGNTSAYSNIHHIVCISCMADGTIQLKVTNAARFTFIKDCLALTNWDINDKPNVVGLPKKQAYVDKLAPPNWHGWPCHQVDHPGYLTKVSASLYQRIWKTLQQVAKDCATGGEVIKNLLIEESEFWEGELSGRPTTPRSTWAKNPDTWYIPFSMDKEAPSPRKPPPDWTDSGMVGILSELFAML